VTHSVTLLVHALTALRLTLMSPKPFGSLPGNVLSHPHQYLLSTIPISATVKTLGVILDTHLTFNQHISSVCKSYFHIRALRHIHSMLTGEMAKSIAVALVSSRLDYANSVLFGTSTTNLHKIQRVQNTLAEIVLTLSYQPLWLFTHRTPGIPLPLPSCHCRHAVPLYHSRYFVP